MAAYIEARVFCPDCAVPVLARARAINHMLHVLLTIFLCGGWWLPIWAVLCVTHDPVWRCQRCGYSCDGPPNPSRVFGWILLGVLGVILLVVVGFFVLAVVMGSVGSTLATTPTPSTATESTPVAIAPREQRPDRMKPVKPDVGNREPETVPEARPESRQGKPAASDEGFAEVKTVQGAPPTTEKTAPPPIATLTPKRNWSIVIGTSKYAAGAAAKSPEEQERWVKRGDAKLLTEPTEVEVIDRDRDFCKVRIDGKEWFVAAMWLNEVK